MEYILKILTSAESRTVALDQVNVGKHRRLRRLSDIRKREETCAFHRCERIQCVWYEDGCVARSQMPSPELAPFEGMPPRKLASP